MKIHLLHSQNYLLYFQKLFALSIAGTLALSCQSSSMNIVNTNFKGKDRKEIICPKFQKTPFSKQAIEKIKSRKCYEYDMQKPVFLEVQKYKQPFKALENFMVLRNHKQKIENSYQKNLRWGFSEKNNTKTTFWNNNEIAIIQSEINHNENRKKILDYFFQKAEIGIPRPTIFSLLVGRFGINELLPETDAFFLKNFPKATIFSMPYPKEKNSTLTFAVFPVKADASQSFYNETLRKGAALTSFSDTRNTLSVVLIPKDADQKNMAIAQMDNNLCIFHNFKDEQDAKNVLMEIAATWNME